MLRLTFCLAAICALLFCRTTHADIRLFDVVTNPTGWAAVTANLVVTGSSDFSSLPDFGLTAFNGPLTSAGGGPFPPGFIPPNVSIDTDRVAGGAQPRLVAGGPSAGLGNPINALVVNDTSDAMTIDFGLPELAFEFSYISFFGSGPITMEVADDSGRTYFFTGLNAPLAGHRYGVIGTDGDKISQIRLLDLGVGNEGMTGGFLIFAIPEPGSWGILVLGGLALLARRRRVKRDVQSLQAV